MFISSSQELLYLVLALCLVWFTIFLCWLLYQAARVLKNANTVIETLSHKLELINDAVQFMRTKVDGVSKNMGVVSSMMAGFAEKFIMGKIADKFEEKISSRAAKSKPKAKTTRSTSSGRAKKRSRKIAKK